jgi:hypothetical protein
MDVYAHKRWEASPTGSIIACLPATSPEVPETKIFVIGAKGIINMLNKFEAAALTDLGFVEIPTSVEVRRSSARNLLRDVGWR